ncbi:hypothetical protein TKK_0005969 [Trichogramma kaykai]|uniref:Tantalus-like domain-containing protein n=1 Tax=Trichogramma kaykai TaxID=54128 RepID=A0ABD2XFW3_9HYME
MSPRRTRRGTIRETNNDSSVIDTSIKSTSSRRTTRRANKSQKVVDTDSDTQMEANSAAVDSSTAQNVTTVSTRKRRKTTIEASKTQDSFLSATLDESKTKNRSIKKPVRTPAASMRRTRTNKSQVEDIQLLMTGDEDSIVKNSEKNKKANSNSIEDLISGDEDEIPKKKSKIIKSKSSLLQKVTSKISKNSKKKQSSSDSSDSNVAADVTPKSSPLKLVLSPHRSSKTPKKSPMNPNSPKSHVQDVIKMLSVPRKLQILDSPASVSSDNSRVPRKLQLLDSPASISSDNSSISSDLNYKNSRRKSSILKEETNKNESSKLEGSHRRNLKFETSKVRTIRSKSPMITAIKKMIEENKSNKSNSSSPVSIVDCKTSNYPLVFEGTTKKSPTKVSFKDVPEVRLSPRVKLSKCVFLDQKSQLSKKSPKSDTLSSLNDNSDSLVTRSHTKKKNVLSNSTSKIETVSSSRNSLDSLTNTKKRLNNSLTKPRESRSLSFISGKMPKIFLNLGRSRKTPVKNSSLSSSKNQKIKSSSKNVLKEGNDSKKNSLIDSLLSSDSAVSPRVTLERLSQEEVNKYLNLKKTNLVNDTPAHLLEKKLLSLKPSNTSTPRDRVKRTLDTSSTKTKTKTNSLSVFGKSLKPKALKKLSPQKKPNDEPRLLEDESEPEYHDNSLINVSDIFDLDNSKKNNTFEVDDVDSKLPSLEKSKKNNTYELNEPKTPALKKKTNDGDQESKKNFKVHFDSTAFKTPSRKPTSISRVSTPGNVLHQKNTPSQIKTPINSHSNSSQLRRVNSVSASDKKTPISKGVRRSSSMSDVKSRKSTHEAQMASVNRLSRPKVIAAEKKLAPKSLIARRIPNFSEIHSKNFQKMESVVDMKKRVEERHTNLTANVPLSAKKVKPNQISSESKLKPAANDAVNGAIYTRFGFNKVRKNEAVDIISKKKGTSADSREKQRENTRSVLKGVRLNRRFEFQMKARSKNT